MATRKCVDEYYDFIDGVLTLVRVYEYKAPRPTPHSYRNRSKGRAGAMHQAKERDLKHTREE